VTNAVFIVPRESFRDEELFVTRDELERAGWVCTIASRAVGVCEGMRGGRVLATVALSQLDGAAYDAVIFVGGNGARSFFDEEDAHRVARRAAAGIGVLAAICIAPGILARAGVLSGRHAAVHASEAKALLAAGAFVPPTSVVVDGKLVTADGPHAAHDFAMAIVRAGSPRPARTTRSLRPPSKPSPV